MIDPNTPEAYEEYRAKWGSGPFIACDSIVTRGPTKFNVKQDEWEILLIKRGKNPFKGMLALPGGFMEPDDYSVVTGSIRELKEETSLIVQRRWALSTVICDGKNRDPRARVVGIVTHFHLPAEAPFAVKAADDADHADWYNISTVLALGNGSLAFDHGDTIRRMLWE